MSARARFEFDDPFDACSIPLLDVDDSPPLTGVRRAEFVLDGSGAVTRLQFCPETPVEP